MTVPLKGALVIPKKATFKILEKKCVFVVDETNVVHQQEIGITSKMPDLYVIKSGITGTDRILLDGLRKVKGMATRLTTTTMRRSQSHRI